MSPRMYNSSEDVVRQEKTLVTSGSHIKQAKFSVTWVYRNITHIVTALSRYLDHLLMLLNLGKIT